jgi:hypothetical protein
VLLNKVRALCALACTTAVIHETASNNVSRITMQNVRFSDVLVTITKLILASPEALAVPFFVLMATGNH